MEEEGKKEERKREREKKMQQVIGQLQVES